MARFPKTVEITKFSGLNNVLPPERTPIDFLKEASNIDIDKSGGVHKRPGYTLKLLGDFHSVWGEYQNFLAVKDNQLVRIRDDFTVQALSSFNSRSTLSYTSIDGSSDVFFVSEHLNGHIVGDSVTPFGIQAPTPPLVSEVSGGGSQLTEGTYQIALTFVDGNGEESGSELASTIAISGGSSLLLQNIKASPEATVSGIKIYCSMPNGDILYNLVTVPNADTQFTIGEVHSLGVTPLKSFNMKPAPLGSIVRYYKGQLYVAKDNILWYSSPFSMKWFNLQSDFFVMENKITEVMPVESGIWIGTERGLYYLSGDSPNTMKLTLLEPVAVVGGTGVKIIGAYLFIEKTPLGYKWLVTTDKGIFVCFNKGVTLNLTEANVVFPEANAGISTFIQGDGINRYVTLLEEKKPSNNASASDIVTATVIRNGVKIN